MDGAVESVAREGARELGQRAVAIDVSLDEFVAMAAVAGRPAPPWVDPSPLSSAGDEVRTAVLASATRSLQARRMVTDAGELAAPIMALVQVITRPELVVTEAAPGRLADQAITASAEVGVHHARLGPHLHRLTAFPTEDLSVWLDRMIGVDEAPEGGAEGAPVDLPAALLRFPPPAAEVDPAVQAAGVPSDDRAELASALRQGGLRVAEAVWLESEGRVRGAQVAWIARPAGGAWLVPSEVATDEPPERVAVVPCTRADLTQELLACLPSRDVDDGSGASG